MAYYWAMHIRVWAQEKEEDGKEAKEKFSVPLSNLPSVGDMASSQLADKPYPTSGKCNECRLHLKASSSSFVVVIRFLHNLQLGKSPSYSSLFFFAK